WRTRRFGHVALSALVLVLLWCAVGAAMHLIIEGAAPIPGRVVATRRTASRATIEYAYGDRRGSLTLVPRMARDLGLGVGAPVTVKMVFGDPYVVGTPRIWTVAPLGAAATFAFVAIFTFILDRVEARRIALLLGGTLVRGRLDQVVRTRFRGS